MGKKKKPGRFIPLDKQTSINIAQGVEPRKNEVLGFHKIPAEAITEEMAIEDAQALFQWLNDHLPLMTFYYLGKSLGFSVQEIEKRLGDPGEEDGDAG